MTISTEQISTIQQANGDVITSRGDRIGSIGQVYVDDETSEPTWVTAKTGLFGTSESFVPLAGANIDGVDVVVNYDKETVKGAPRLDSDGLLSAEEEEALYAHYGLSGGHPGDSNQTEGAHQHSADTPADDTPADVTPADDTPAVTTQPAPQSLVSVTTATVENGHPRLRKYAVTENVIQSEPGRRDVQGVVREPNTEAP